MSKRLRQLASCGGYYDYPILPTSLDTYMKPDEEDQVKVSVSHNVQTLHVIMRSYELVCVLKIFDLCFNWPRLMPLADVIGATAAGNKATAVYGVQASACSSFPVVSGNLQRYARSCVMFSCAQRFGLTSV